MTVSHDDSLRREGGSMGFMTRYARVRNTLFDTVERLCVQEMLWRWKEKKGGGKSCHTVHVCTQENGCGGNESKNIYTMLLKKGYSLREQSFF